MRRYTRELASVGPGWEGRRQVEIRALWARTNHAFAELGGRGFKSNTPDGWVSDGPVWWYGDDAYRLDANPSGYAAITKATSIIVNRLAASDWTVDGTTPPWVRDPMAARPDGRYSMSASPAALRLPAPLFWGQWVRSALLYGMGWITYKPDVEGAPLPGSCYLLRPGAVQADPYAAGVWRLTGRDGESVALDDELRVEDSGGWRILPLRNPIMPIDAYTGMSVGVLEHHAVELGIVASIADYSAGQYTGSGVPSGFLKTTTPNLTKEQAEALSDNWLKRHGGGKRSVAVLTAAVDYTPIATSPLDMAVAEMKRLSLVDVANAFCVPLFMLGAPTGSSSVYSNVMAEQQALWVHTLQPWARAIEATLSALLPAGTGLMIQLPGMEWAIAQTMQAPEVVNDVP